MTQARSQAARGEFVAAATSVERALRIEPDNPLVWLELGRIRLAAGEAAQAENLARKALALASGSSSTQAEAWRLIAESYRARDRNVDARDAEQRARALGP